MNNLIPKKETTKQRKVKSYVKPESVKQLEKEMYEHKYRNSVIPKSGRFITKHEDITANGLTKCINSWAKVNAAHFQRMNTTGQYDAKLGIYRRSGATKGVTDILVIHKGKTLNIEVKIGKDRMSSEQIKMRSSIEAAGGVYWIVKSYDDFLEKINKLFIPKNNQ